jgi:hypothetical protein
MKSAEIPWNGTFLEVLPIVVMSLVGVFIPAPPPQRHFRNSPIAKFCCAATFDRCLGIADIEQATQRA